MKILIIDDHALFREGLSYVLQKMSELVNIIEASNYDQALQLISNNTDLDLILLDLYLPGKDGFETLNKITQKYPAMPVVIVSASDDHRDIKHALDAGAMGYIPKNTASSVMLKALLLVLSGGIYVPTVKIDNAASTLTPRQLEVLELLVEGHSNKQIASRLEVAEATVKMHVTSIFISLQVNNRTQAAMEAKKLGICKSYN